MRHMIENKFSVKKILAAVAAAVLCLGTVFGAAPVRAVAETEDTLQSIIDGAADGAIVKLEGDVSQNVTVGAEKNITLDLAGHMLNGKIVNNGTLALTDSVGGGAAQITSSADGVQSVVENGGTFTLNGATLRGVGTGASTEANVIVNKSGGKLYVRAGEVVATSTGTKWGFGINNLGGGVIEEISGGCIESYITNSGSGSNALAINNSGTIKTISGGTLYAHTKGTGYATSIRINGGGVVQSITGGDLSAYVDNAASDITKAYGIYVTNNGTVNKISGGDISARTTAMQWAFGIWNQGKIGSVEGGTVSALIEHNRSAPNAIAISNEKTIDSISGGTFYAYSSNSNGGTIGVRSRGADAKVLSLTGGTVRLNKQNDNHYFLSESNGSITFGQGYSLAPITQNSYRYVLGADQTVKEEYKDGESVMTGIVSDKDGTAVKEYKLVGTELNKAAYIGDVGYASVSAAVADSKAGDTVRVAQDAEESIVIEEGKDVVVDFGGYRITGTITNGGTVTLRGEADGGMYKQSAANGLDAIIYNRGMLTVDGISIRNDGINNIAEADGIYNYEGAMLTFNGGRMRCISYGTKWSHAVINAGDAVINGGDIQSISLSTATASNIVAIAATGSGKVTVNGGSIYSQSAGNGGSAVGIRTQGTSQAEIVSGVVKAVVSNPNGACEAYAVNVDGASSGITVSGGTVTAETYNDYAFGIFAKGSVKISGGRVSAYANHMQKAPNIIGVSINAGATVEISGGYISGYSKNVEAEKGETYGVRNNGTLTVSGGVFGYNKSNGNSSYIFTNSGTTTFAEGVSIVDGTFDKIGYASADGDVIVEQRDGEKFIGANVYRDGELVYEYEDHARSGSVLDGFVTVDGDKIGKSDFAALTESAVVEAAYSAVPAFCFLGSSVTYGAANHGSSFVNYIANTLDCRVIKEAVSGTTLADNNANSYVSRMLANIPATEKIDHLIVQLSTNDVTQNIVVGDVAPNKNIEEFDRTTTVGAMEYIIAYAKKTWGCKVSFYTNPCYNNAQYEALMKKLDLLKAKWNIGVVDFYYYTDMDALDQATLSSYMADPIHPNAMGYEWMGGVFSEYLVK